MSTTTDNGKYFVTNLYDVDYLLDGNRIVVLQGNRAPSVADMEGVARRYNELAALREAARHALNTIALEAEQLDTWAQQSRDGGWSTHQVDPMRKKADTLRREAAALREALGDSK